VFAIAAPVCGLVYWWFTDWWAYVDDPRGPWPKFVMPWWWQVGESGVVGSLAGGLLAGVWRLGWWGWSRRAIRCSRPRAALTVTPPASTGAANRSAEN
jgi:hypothetical protein